MVNKILTQNIFFSDDYYFIPIQLPNCRKLIISSTHNKNLGSTKGLPIKVSDILEIIRQEDFDCDDLDYSNIIDISFVETSFKNFNFVKKWNPKKNLF